MADLESLHLAHRAAFADMTLVIGAGNPCAALMLVGEAPGAQEEAQGRPFVGTAGKNLTAFLACAQLSRDALYITNAVKFRPSKQSAKGRLSNRTPTREEVERFRPWLLAEIDAVSPLVVATLGNTALRAVTNGAHVIGNVHGRPMEQLLPCGAVLFPLYHPASVIYRRELKQIYEDDVRALGAYLAGKHGLSSYSNA